MQLPDYIRSHSRASTITITARMLVLDIPRNRHQSTAALLMDIAGVDYCAGVWSAMSPYIFCDGCKRVHVVSASIPVTVLKECGQCKGTTKTNRVTHDNLAHWLKGLEPEIQELSLQYLYDRQVHYETTYKEGICNSTS